ncbi:DUF1538 family protein [Blautia producta]|uniref:DUF1538 family protein n=1 Tax=Blautia producta TaxID=33035 RepID=UPI0031B56650
MTKLKEKISEALSSVLPITCIVFLLGAVLLVVGMGFFSLGADMSMMPMGDGIGNALVSSEKKVIMFMITFAIGFIVTIAEPDLTVLSHHVSGILDRVCCPWQYRANSGSPDPGNRLSSQGSCLYTF